MARWCGGGGGVREAEGDGAEGAVAAGGAEAGEGLEAFRLAEEVDDRLEARIEEFEVDVRA